MGAFTESGALNKMGETERNEKYTIQYAQRLEQTSKPSGIDYKISYKKEINMFVRMDIEESIYAGVLEKPSKKQ